MRTKDFAFPRLSLRFLQVWRRNFLVWRKLAIPSMLGNLADPMLYMLGLGYGLGRLMGEIDGLPYITFLAAGIVCFSTMNTATFETLYSAFSRMHVQKTWDSIMHAPLNLDDIILAEAVWAASKSFLSGVAILLVIWVLGLTASPMILWIVPLAFLVGLTFASLGLIMNALSPSYDFFLYYFTLFITPMVLLCGVFFPVDALPEALQAVSAVLPLSHAVQIARPLVGGTVPADVLLHIAVLLAYAVAGFYVALVLSRRRLLA
ncbi:MAG TPA: ABC transporter permease [Burkholderiales bacterium]|nr:ABC transporter permease [Burkholderiales bacterium]